MKNTAAKTLSVSLSALFVLSMLVISPVFSGFPPRSYNGPGLGYGTFYVSPQDNLFTSPVNGTWFKIQVRMENFTHVYSWQYMIVFKNDLLWLDFANVTEVAGADYIFAGKSRTSLSVVVDAFNATHTRLLAFESLQGAVAPAAGTDKGVTDVWFQIIKDPGLGERLSSMLFFQTDMSGATDDTFTIDEGSINENDCTMKDGYYENKYVTPPAAIYVDPPRKVDPTLTPSHNFTVDVNVKNATALRQFGFKLAFNSTLLNVVNATLGAFVPPASIYTIETNNTQGYVRYQVAVNAPDPPLNGNGTLAVITFHVESLGFCNLTLTETFLVDDFGDPIPHSMAGGYFSNAFLAKIAVQPPEIFDLTLLPPQTIEINVTIAGVEDLYGYEFKLGYDPTVLIGLQVTIHDVLGEVHYIPNFSVDNTNGIVHVSVAYYEPANPISTIPPVTVVTLKFRIMAGGITELDLYDTSLTDSAGSPITHEVQDGVFCNIMRDIALINVTRSRTEAYEGWIVNINVTAENQGEITETFNVEVHYGTSGTVGTITFIDVDPNAAVTKSIAWNTAGVQPCQNYTIWAEAVPLPFETDLADNSFSDGAVKIWLMGDINRDRKVDGKDITLAAVAFGSYPGHPRWNLRADLNEDNKIDGKDLTKIALNFGKTC